MTGLSFSEIACIVFLLGVVPAVGIIFFGLMTALLWRAVARRDGGNARSDH